MKFLLLGGPRFLGRHLIDAALDRGHEITLFNRGKTNPEDYPQLEKLVGDRDGGLDPLRGRRWDAVLDTCGYVPRVVEATASLLAEAAGSYTFISSISVYRNFQAAGMDEHAPLGVLADESVEEITHETYGPLKVLCEQVVERHFAGRALQVRAGLIVGPYDSSDRFTYWVVRTARGGEILAPGEPASPVQLVDGRDLASWIIQMAEKGHTGAYNATGPALPVSMQQVLHTCLEIGGSPGELVWIPGDFLLKAGAAPWTELPLWIPESDPDAVGLSQVNCSRAIAAGLAFRPLRQTIRDTLEWATTRPDDWQWRAGLRHEREQELLAAWQATRSKKV
jgi:2'-hydroxyisoflavone reductase